MQYTVLLSTGENTRNIEEEEKFKFTLYVLQLLDVDFPPDLNLDWPLSQDDQLNFYNLLHKYTINIVDSLDDSMQIFVDSDLVGTWDKSSYRLKQDLSTPNPKKQLYLEMKNKFWTIFDEEKGN